MSKHNILPRSRVGWVAMAGVALLIAAASCRYRFVIVTGGSMEPTFRDRQFVLMDRGTKGVTQLRRGDIVVFRHGADVFVKRVHAVEGDTVRLVEFSNGITCLVGDEPFPVEGLRRLARKNDGKLRFTHRVVPSGRVFVLGDNRIRSFDSRAFGSIPASEILGRIVTPAEVMASLPVGLTGKRAESQIG